MEFLVLDTEACSSHMLSRELVLGFPLLCLVYQTPFTTKPPAPPPMTALHLKPHTVACDPQTLFCSKPLSPQSPGQPASPMSKGVLDYKRVCLCTKHTEQLCFGRSKVCLFSMDLPHPHIQSRSLVTYQGIRHFAEGTTVKPTDTVSSLMEPKPRGGHGE